MSNPSLPIGFFKGQSPTSSYINQGSIWTSLVTFIQLDDYQSLWNAILCFFFFFHAIEYKPSHMDDFQYCRVQFMVLQWTLSQGPFISQSKVILQILKPDLDVMHLISLITQQRCMLYLRNIANSYLSGNYFYSMHIALQRIQCSCILSLFETVSLEPIFSDFMSLDTEIHPLFL